jgi:PAS domain S-box-containing protein
VCRFDTFFYPKTNKKINPNILHLSITCMFRPLTSSLTSHLLRKALLAFLTILLFFNSHALGSQENRHKTVLIVYSLGHMYPVMANWDRNIWFVFRNQQDINIKVNTENLDLSLYHDSDYIRRTVDIFRYRYLESKPDLIIAVFEPAFDFVLKYGQELFPDVPIIFGGIERLSFENPDLYPNITGVFQDGTAYGKTLDLALNLHPGTRHIVVIGGAGLIEQSWLESARKAFQRYVDRLQFTYMVGLSIDEIQNRLKKILTNTVVLSFPITQDSSGKSIIYRDALTQISKASSVPVYSFYQGAFGKGIVGGYIKNFSVQAKTTAEMGLRVLKGIPIQEIPAIQKKDLEYMFDWRQLKRWSISENRLPPGSIVKFKELTTWDRYKGQIIGALILILFQTLIIFYLLYQRRIRLRAQEQVLQAELKYRTVADYTFDWEYWQSPDGSLRYVSPSCERVCGYTTQDFIRNPSLLQDIIVTKDKAVWDEHRCINKKEMQSEEIQFRIQRPNGEIRWIEHACQPVFDQKGKKRGVRASNRDITRRKQSEESLKAISEEAGLLAGKLLNAQELERARVARELHDDITQRLAVMNIEVDNLEMQHQSLAEPLKEKLQQLGIDLGELSSDIHMISRQLHPSILYELGLIKAIETECNNYTRLRRISPTLDLDNTIKDVPKEIALCIYRILQEGLRNIGKHAMASDIQVRLCMRKNTICLFLKDNGIGFDSASAKERAGIGLASMVERARLVNGDLSIESGTEIGTTIKLKIPIPLPPRYN